jgi:predicted permease
MAAVNLSPDAHVILYVLAISVGSGILFGLSPALQLVRRDIASALKADAGLAGRVRGSRLRGFLVGAQVAVSIFFLATAGLLARGMLRSRTAQPGFETRGIYVLSGDFGGIENDAAAVLRHEKAIVEKLRGRPDVSGITLGTVPFAGTWTPPMVVNGAGVRTLASYASETWFDVIGVPIVRGRNFTSQEVSSEAPVALISESTARRFWLKDDPLGQRFALDKHFTGKFTTFEVIGIVKDVRFANLTRVDPSHVYLLGAGANSNVLLRLQGDRRQAIASVTSALQSLEPAVLRDARLVSLDDRFVSIMRAFSQALAAFAAILAALALTLAGVGIYGVVAYLVGQRTREIGIRMALGANRRAVLRNVIIQALRPVFTGMACGIGMACALSAVLHQTLIFPGSMDFFYGVPFYDPATFGVLFCFVTVLAGVASFAPARRALRVDPMVALRHE